MLYENLFKNPKDAAEILRKIEHCSDGSGQIRLMEICGTHTMAIARSGIRSVLPGVSPSSFRPRMSGLRDSCGHDRHDP